MQRDRSWRRAQRERKIREIYEWMRDRNWYIWNNPTEDDDRHRELIRTARNRHSAPKACSGWCCGNPRKHFGAKTMSEQRFEIRCEEEFQENEVSSNFKPSKRKW